MANAGTLMPTYDHILLTKPLGKAMRDLLAASKAMEGATRA